MWAEQQWLNYVSRVTVAKLCEQSNMAKLCEQSNMAKLCEQSNSD